MQSLEEKSSRAHPLSWAAAFICLTVGLSSLSGWTFAVDCLKSLVPGAVAMDPSSAMAFMLMGAGLWLSMAGDEGRYAPTLRLLTAVIVLVIAGDTLVDHALGRDLATTSPIAYKWRSGTLGNFEALRMSAASALTFAMLATASLLLRTKSDLLRWLVQALVLASMLISMLALVGYAYGFDDIYQVGSYSSLPFQTAASLFLLGVGMLYMRADFGIMLPIRSPNLGGLLARQMLPAVLFIPLLLGWMRLVETEQLGEHAFEVGVTINTTTLMIILTVLLWLTARSMNGIDKQRELAKKAEIEMRELSELDPLTGVLNRRSLQEQMEREWSRVLRHGRPLAAIMLDIDHFKQVNDTRGHAAGDAALKKVAAILLRGCRPSDVVCRYGGDEFCILIPEATELGAAMLAQRLCDDVADLQIQVGGSRFTITASFGVAGAADHVGSVGGLIEEADQALLAAKQAGRARVSCSSASSAEKCESISVA